MLKRIGDLIYNHLGVLVDEMLIDDSYFLIPDFKSAPSFVHPKWWKDLTC